MKKQTKALIVLAVLVIVGCTTTKKVSNALLGAPQATVSDILSPFVPDPADTNKVIPNPALVSTVNTAAGSLGPWGVVGGIVLGAGLAAGATWINQKKK